VEKFDEIEEGRMELYNYYKQYINGNGVDDNTDSNSNSVNKSFNNFRSQISNDPLRELTETLMKKKAEENGYEKESEEFWQKEKEGIFYFHDKTQGLIPYCFAMDSSFLMAEGRPYGTLHSLPAKRSDSFIAQLIEVVMDMSQSHAGAIAVPDLFVNYSRFTINEKHKTYKEIENDFQKFIHVVNNQFRVGGQSPFTNLNIMDREMLKVNYDINDETFLDEIMKNQKIFVRFFAKGDPKTGVPFRFPVCTILLSYTEEQGFIDQEFFNWFSRKGNSGVFNIYITKDPLRWSACCRLSLDMKDLMKHFHIDSFGNGSKSVGSHRVITLNLVKILNENDSEQYLKDQMKLVAMELFLHRKLLQEHIDKGFLHFFKPLGWENLERNFFSTIGFVGLFEACKGNIERMYEIIQIMKNYIFELSDEFSMPINLEQVPAEGCAITLAKGTEYEILSNQYLPLWYDYNVVDRLKIAGRFDKEVTGGAITHINVDKKMTDMQFRKVLVFAAEQGVNHFAINYVYSLCEEGHFSNGKFEKCGICGKPIIDYVTRIIGYFTPVSSWSEGRREEFKKRKFEHNTKI